MLNLIIYNINWDMEQYIKTHLETKKHYVGVKRKVNVFGVDLWVKLNETDYNEFFRKQLIGEKDFI